MIGRRTATVVCWFFVVRANSKKGAKCRLPAHSMTTKQQHLVYQYTLMKKQA